MVSPTRYKFLIGGPFLSMLTTEVVSSNFQHIHCREYHHDAHDTPCFNLNFICSVSQFLRGPSKCALNIKNEIRVAEYFVIFHWGAGSICYPLNQLFHIFHLGCGPYVLSWLLYSVFSRFLAYIHIFEGSYMVNNDCIGNMKLWIVEFLKSSTAFQLFRIQFQLLAI